MIQTNREYCLAHPDELLNMTCTPGGLCILQGLVSWRETHGLGSCEVTSCGNCKQEWLGFERDETIEDIKKDADREAASDWVDDFRDEIAGMLGIACNGMVDDVQDAVIDELDKRLMPEGMEWPKDRNENPFDPRKLYDRGCGAVDYVLIGFVNGKQWARVVSHDGIDLSPEELDDCEPEVLAADGMPIKVDETVYLTDDNVQFEVQAVRKGAAKDEFGEWYDAGLLTHTRPDTQERIDKDAHKVSDPCTYFSSDGSCAKCRFVSQYGDADSAYEACPKSVELERMAILDLLRRQRELCAKGGE